MTAGDDPTAERVCMMMERQVDHIVRLVDDLMEVSRITRGLIELRKENTDLATAICDAVETSKPLIAANEHQLAISLPPEPIPLYADPVRLGQVFANLLNNAAKYTERGGQIWITAKREGSHESFPCEIMASVSRRKSCPKFSICSCRRIVRLAARKEV